MTLEITPDPGSLLPDTPTIDTPDGPRPTVPDAEAYSGGTFDTGGGARSFGPLELKHYYDDFLRSASWPEGGGGITTMSTIDAAQMGLYHLIRKMTWSTFDLQALIDGQPASHMTVRSLKKIWLDWPRWDDREIPVDNALITAPDDVPFDPDAQRNALLLDDTVDVYAPGTMIRHLGEVEVPLQLVVWFAHARDRRGFHARFERHAAAEVAHEHWNRVVVVPEYFGRQVTLSLTGFSRPDTPESVQANRWPFTASLMAIVEMVELVRIPGYMVDVHTGTDVDGLP